MADESIERDDERDDEVEAHQLGELRQSEMRQTELLKDEEGPDVEGHRQLPNQHVDLQNTDL